MWTALAAKACQPGMAGSGGGGFIKRQMMRATESSRMVMPNDLWSWTIDW